MKTIVHVRSRRDRTHLNHLRRVLAGGLAVATLSATAILTAGAASAAPGVSPSSVTLNLAEGGSTTVNKTVATPPIPPKPDVLILADTTGSMGPALNGLKADLGNLVTQVKTAQPDAQFGVANYRDFVNCAVDGYAYKLDLGITANVAAVQAAVNGLALGNGCDEPEQQLNALFQIAANVPTVGWRAGSTRIVAWFGDAPGHDPSFGHTLGAVNGALVAANIRVIAIPVATGASGLNSTGQATAITDATGGKLVASTNPGQVAAAILTGLQNLPVTVTAQVGACDSNLTVSQSPASLTVVSGANATFVETISVGAGATPGSTLACTVNYLVNGMLSAGFTQTITEVVPKHASTLVVANATSDFHDPGTLSGRLTDSTTGAPIAGAPVSFVMAAESCGGITNAAGTASCEIVPSEPAGSYPINGAFAGDSAHTPTTGSGTYVVTLEETTLTYTGATHVANGTPATLSAVLKEDGTTPIGGGRSVVLTLGSGSGAQTCTGATDATGTASCVISPVNQPAAATSLPVTAQFGGDGFYRPSSDSASVLLRYMTGRAFGVSSRLTTLLGPIGIAPRPDTGQVSTSQAFSTTTPCLVTISGMVAAKNVCANVTTSVAPGRSEGTASVGSVSINTGIPGVPLVEASLIKSTSTTSCDGSSGGITLGSLKIAGVAQSVASVGPNSTLGVGLLATLILNEQVPVPGGLTVNAIHLKVGVLGQGADVVIGSATSDIHNCV